MNRTTMEIDKLTLEALKAVGKKNQTYDRLIRQRIRCNAAACESIGSIEVNVRHGKFGTLALFVCPKCIGRLQNEQ